MDRDELLGREDEAWSAFVDAFAAVTEDRRDVPGAVPGWSVKDLVWHCGYWADDAALRIPLIARGEPDDVGSKTNDQVAQESKSMSWDEIVTRSEAGRERVRSVLSSLEEISPTVESEFADETFDHYDEHAAEIERFSAGS